MARKVTVRHQHDAKGRWELIHGIPSGATPNPARHLKLTRSYPTSATKSATTADGGPPRKHQDFGDFASFFVTRNVSTLRAMEGTRNPSLAPPETLPGAAPGTVGTPPEGDRPPGTARGRSALWREGCLTAKLALPLVAGQLSQMLIGISDTVMLGAVGVVPLAASAFAQNLLYVPLLFGFGLLTAVSIRTSQARGAKDPAAARAALRHGNYLALAIGGLTVLLAWLGLPYLEWLCLLYLEWFGQDAKVAAATPEFFIICAISLVFAIGSHAIKSHADALDRPWPAFWIMFSGVVLNIGLNWVFIFGKFGVPAGGLVGAGWATLIARLLTYLGLILWCVRASPELRQWMPFHWFRWPDWVALRDLLKVGLPGGVHLLAEVGAFVCAALLIGTLGAAELAAHQVAITCVGTIFMVPLGISMALTVRVGEAYGARQPERLRPIVVSGWLMVLAIAAAVTVVLLLANQSIAAAFIKTTDTSDLANATRELAAGLLLLSAAFLTCDALQVASTGGLRGLNDVRYAAATSLVAYWSIALPLGIALAFWAQGGVFGMWWGLTLGLVIAAAALSRRLWKTIHRPLPPAPPVPGAGGAGTGRIVRHAR